MAEFLRDFMDLFQGDGSLRFKVVFRLARQSAAEERRMYALLPVPRVSSWWAYARAWDLAVTADHLFAEIVDTQRVPIVLVPHGAKAKCPGGDDEEYSYGKHAFDKCGRLRYACMFEERQSDRDRAVAANPVFEDVIVVVGSLVNDKLLAVAERRDIIRQEFGLEPNDTAVFVLSTWGPHSLLHVMGEDLLAQMRKLQGRFKFLLSCHPHEYRPKPHGQRVWGEYLREQRQYGFVVREPSDSWMPCMVASDIVVSDYTSLIQSAALLEKPIVLTPVPGELIWTGSVNWRVRQFAPMLHDATRLGEVLIEAQTNYPVSQLQDLARTICPYPGQAAERIRSQVYRLLHRDGVR